MSSNRVVIVILLVALVLTSSMSYFGQDSFMAYARSSHFKKIHHDIQSDISKKIIKPKMQYHVSK